MSKSKHYDTYIIYLVQNIFDSQRTISLNASYIILFKYPRDKSQVSHLDKQVYPGGNDILIATNRDVKAPCTYSLMLIDFNQTAPEKFRLSNTQFSSGDFPEAIPYRLTSRAWGCGEVSHGKTTKLLSRSNVPFINSMN